MNIKPATSIKVSEMTKIDNIDDDSILLIVQNGVGHKVSFADLKNAIIQNIKKEITQNSTNIRQLKTQQESDKKQIKVYVQTQLQEFQENVVTSARNGIERFKSQIQGNIDQYHADADLNFNKFKIDVDAKNLPNLSKNQTNLANRLNKLETIAKSQLEKALSSTTQSITELSIVFQKNISQLDQQVAVDGQQFNILSTDFQKSMIDMQNKISDLDLTFKQSCQSLSSQLDEFDVKLYGLTIEDLDETTFKTITSHVKTGDIELLSAKVKELEQKIEVLDELLK